VGADPNRAGPRGWTAVHQAASRGNKRILRAVLNAGRDPARKDQEGRTALDVARAARLRSWLRSILAAHR
jgi:ankyrin repeat protein